MDDKRIDFLSPVRAEKAKLSGTVKTDRALTSLSLRFHVEAGRLPGENIIICNACGEIDAPRILAD